MWFLYIEYWIVKLGNACDQPGIYVPVTTCRLLGCLWPNVIDMHQTGQMCVPPIFRFTPKWKWCAKSSRQTKTKWIKKAFFRQSCMYFFSIFWLTFHERYSFFIAQPYSKFCSLYSFGFISITFQPMEQKVAFFQPPPLVAWLAPPPALTPSPSSEAPGLLVQVLAPPAEALSAYSPPISGFFEPLSRCSQPSWSETVLLLGHVAWPQ